MHVKLTTDWLYGLIDILRLNALNFSWFFIQHSFNLLSALFYWIIRLTNNIKAEATCGQFQISFRMIYALSGFYSRICLLSHDSFPNFFALLTIEFNLNERLFMRFDQWDETHFVARNVCVVAFMSFICSSGVFNIDISWTAICFLQPYNYIN